MGDLSITLKGTLDSMITAIAEETGQTKQTVVRQVLWDFFKAGGFEDKQITDRLKAELRADTLKADVNRVRFGAMRDKRSIFLPQLVGRFMSKVRTNNRNITLGEMEVLTQSYIAEASLYGPVCEKKTRMRIAEEMESIKIMREYEDGI